MDLSFMHKPNRPLAGSLKAAANALAAWKIDGKVPESLIVIENDVTFSVRADGLRPIASERVIAGQCCFLKVPLIAVRGAVFASLV